MKNLLFIFVILSGLIKIFPQTNGLQFLGTVPVNKTEIALSFQQKYFGDAAYGMAGSPNFPFRFVVDEENGLIIVDDGGKGLGTLKIFNLKNLSFVKNISYPKPTIYFEGFVYPVFDVFGDFIIVQLGNERLFAMDFSGQIVKEFDFNDSGDIEMIQYIVSGDYMFYFSKDRKYIKLDKKLNSIALNENELRSQSSAREYNCIYYMSFDRHLFRIHSDGTDTGISQDFYEGPTGERERVFGSPPLDVDFNSPKDDAVAYIAVSGMVYIMRTRPSGIDFYRFTPKHIRQPLQAAGIMPPDGPSASPRIVKLTSSPWLGEAANSDEYHPIYAFDGNPKTGFLEKGSQNAGTFIEITLDRTWDIEKLRIMPGLFDNQYWKQNNRVKKATLYLDGATKGISVTFTDSMVIQDVLLPRGTQARVLKLVVDEVYPTTKWDDTGFNEIELWAGGKKLTWDLVEYVEYFDHLVR